MRALEKAIGKENLRTMTWALWILVACALVSIRMQFVTLAEMVNIGRLTKWLADNQPNLFPTTANELRDLRSEIANVGIEIRATSDDAMVIEEIRRLGSTLEGILATVEQIGEWQRQP